MEAVVRGICSLLDIFIEYPVSSLCFAVSLFCLVAAWVRKSDFFTPVNVYVFTQTLTLGIAYLKLDSVMTDFKWFTWMVWLGSMAAFLLGVATYRFVAGKERQFVAPPGIPKAYNWHRHFAVSLLLFAAFLVGVAMMVYTVGNFILLTGESEKWVSADAEYPTYSPDLVLSSPLIVMWFAVASFKAINPFRKIRIFSKIMVLVTLVVATLTYPSRTPLFLSLGTLIILYNFLRRRIPAWFILLGVGLGFSFFVGIALLRAQYGTRSLEGMAAKAVITIPYFYIANNYWNLDYALNSPGDYEIHPFTYGIDAFAGIFAYTRYPDKIREMTRWDKDTNEKSIKIGGYNTFGYQWHVYKDFGTAGTVVFPFFAGFLMSWFYRKVTTANSVGLWLAWAVGLYFLGWSFFLPGYKMGLYWLWIYIIAVASLWCSGRPGRSRQKLPENCVAGER